jgi:hypothetical protein
MNKENPIKKSKEPVQHSKNEDRFLSDLIKNFGKRFGAEEIKKLYKLLALFFKDPACFKKKDEISQRLEKKFGRKQCEQCFAYHLLVGSTPDPNLIQFFDFEGDDSIIKSIKEFVNSQEKQSQNES